MVRALSTHLFLGHRLTSVWLERIWNAGIPQVELFCARQHFDYRDRAQIGELGHWFRDSQLKVHSLHSPMHSDDVSGRSGPDSIVSITEPVKQRRMRAVDEIKRTLEIAETIPFRFLVQHFGVEGDEYDERKIDAAFTSLEELSVFARQRGVEVLLENTSNAMASPERLLMFLEQTHLDLNFCFDTGHANLHEGGVEPAFRTMKSRIRSLHVHDNNGKEDGHLFPMAAGGTIDWLKTMELLRTLREDCPLLMEPREVPDLEHPLDETRRVFDRLEALKPEPER